MSDYGNDLAREIGGSKGKFKGWDVSYEHPGIVEFSRNGRNEVIHATPFWDDERSISVQVEDGSGYHLGGLNIPLRTTGEIGSDVDAYFKALGRSWSKIIDIVVPLVSPVGASDILRVAEELMVGADTFECPDCGTKVMEKTGYCVKCKKKVKKGSMRMATRGHLSDAARVLRPIAEYYVEKTVGSKQYEIEEIVLLSAGTQFGMSVTFWDHEALENGKILIEWGKPSVKEM